METVEAGIAYTVRIILQLVDREDLLLKDNGKTRGHIQENKAQKGSKEVWLHH